MCVCVCLCVYRKQRSYDPPRHLGQLQDSLAWVWVGEWDRRRVWIQPCCHPSVPSQAGHPAWMSLSPTICSMEVVMVPIPEGYCEATRVHMCEAARTVPGLRSRQSSSDGNSIRQSFWVLWLILSSPLHIAPLHILLSFLMHPGPQLG